jgi:hypothetical protein
MRSNAAEAEKPVIAHSWDFDGMLACDIYKATLKMLITSAGKIPRALNEADYAVLAETVIAANKEKFFDIHIAAAPNADHIIYIGSDRQDLHTDRNNGFKFKKDMSDTHSCFPFYKALVKQLCATYTGIEIKFSNLLLEDIYRETPAGSTFNAAEKCYLSLSPAIYTQLAALINKYEYDDTNQVYSQIKLALKAVQAGDDNLLPQYTDKSKFLLMLAQIHHALNTYAGDRPLTFQFSDDRGDILSNANDTLTKHQHQIPSCVTIQLEQYIPSDNSDAKENHEHPFYQPFMKSEITGANKEKSDLKTVFNDICQAHIRLNENRDIPAIVLHTTVQERVRKSSVQLVETAQEKALSIIKDCVRHLSATAETKYTKKLLKLVEDRTATARQILQKIKELAEADLTSNTYKSGKPGTFAKVFDLVKKERNQTIDDFSKKLLTLNVENPSLEELQNLRLDIFGKEAMLIRNSLIKQ